VARVAGNHRSRLCPFASPRAGSLGRRPGWRATTELPWRPSVGRVERRHAAPGRVRRRVPGEPGRDPQWPRRAPRQPAAHGPAGPRPRPGGLAPRQPGAPPENPGIRTPFVLREIREIRSRSDGRRADRIHARPDALDRVPPGPERARRPGSSV